MSKIFNLTYNELIKQFKKKSISIIIAFILILGILLPLAIQRLTSDKDTYIDNRNTIGINNAEIQIESFKNAKTDIDKLQLDFAILDKEYWEFMNDNNVTFRDWKEIALEGYLENSYEIIVLNKIINGIDKKVLQSNELRYISLSQLEEYSNLSKENLQKKLSELIKINEEKRNIVKSNDYMKYLDKKIKEKETLVEDRKKSLKECEIELKKNSDDKTLKNNLEYIKVKLISDEKILNTYKYRYNNKIGFDENDWKNNTLNDIEYLEENLGEPIADEESFNKGAVSRMQSGRMNYEEYKEVYNVKKVNLQQKIDRDWYSLNNNLPQLEFIRDARTLVNGTYEVVIILTILLIIIIGGGIVSSEFSKGTIRLLMIRPVSRWKILLSKLLSLFIISYGIIISTVIISAITSSILLGFNTLQTSIIETVNGKIIIIPYIQYVTTKVLLSSTSVIFIISLAFMISSLLKNTALAVSISTIIYLAAMPLTLILGFSNMKWIVNTIIPYINFSMLNISSGFLNDLMVQNGIIFNPYLGAMQLVIVSIIILIISFGVFTKKDIKN